MSTTTDTAARKTPDILTENAETFRKKTADYGNSWRAIGLILYVLSQGKPVTLQTPHDFISMGLFTRRLDKFAREFNGTFLSDELNFEAVSDSAEDESVYAAMSAENHGDRGDAADLAELMDMAMAVLSGDVDLELEVEADDE